MLVFLSFTLVIINLDFAYSLNIQTFEQKELFSRIQELTNTSGCVDIISENEIFLSKVARHMHKPKRIFTKLKNYLDYEGMCSHVILFLKDIKETRAYIEPLKRRNRFDVRTDIILIKQDPIVRIGRQVTEPLSTSRDVKRLLLQPSGISMLKSIVQGTKSKN